MIELKRILVPTDFSDFSEPALNYGCLLAEQFNSDLHLLNVVASPALYGNDPVMLPAEALADHLNEVRAHAEAKLKELPEQSNELSVVRDVRQGVAFVEIIRYAKENDIDLIVIGTHGRTGLSHVFLGSVAERVVRKAACPVLTVRPEGHQFVMP